MTILTSEWQWRPEVNAWNKLPMPAHYTQSREARKGWKVVQQALKVARKLGHAIEIEEEQRGDKIFTIIQPPRAAQGGK